MQGGVHSGLHFDGIVTIYSASNANRVRGEFETPHTRVAHTRGCPTLRTVKDASMD